MTESERPTPLYWLRIVNPDAQDYERVGMHIGTLTREDDPNLTEPYYIVDFGDGYEPTAFVRDELERFFAS